MTPMANAECGASYISQWRVDTSSHEIIAAELSLSTVTDAEVLPRGNPY